MKFLSAPALAPFCHVAEGDASEGELHSVDAGENEATWPA